MIMALAAHPTATFATHLSVKARDGKARCGVLTTKNGSIDTPAVLLYTRRGGPLSLTSPDMLAAVTPPVQGVQLNAMHFLENPDARILREYGRGAHGFLCLRGLPILASNRDPTMYEYGTRPGTDREVHVSIHSGGHMVGPERYMETVAALRPDMYVSLCDEVTADAKAKRVATATKRTTAWLEECLRLHAAFQQPQQPQPQQTQQQQQVQDSAAVGQAAAADNNGSSRSRNGDPAADSSGGPAASGPLSGSLLLAALGGGGSPAERARAAAAVAGKEDVGGYALCGLGTGESPDQRLHLIAASLGALPPGALESRPVFAAGLAASPDEILAAVAEGVDLMDCAFVAQITAGGYALTFPLRPPPGWRLDGVTVAPTEAQPGGGRAGGGGDEDGGPVQGAGHEAAAAAAAAAVAPAASASAFGPAGGSGLGPDVSIGADDTKINLWSTSYRLDKGPLLPGCRCFACRRHSRAYVHHLLNTHEMLADVLLEAHNTSHLLAFCQAIREAIAEGRFTLYREWFRSLRTAPLVAVPRHVTAKRRASGPPGAGEDVAAAEGALGGSGGTGVVSGQGDDAARSKWVRV